MFATFSRLLVAAAAVLCFGATTTPSTARAATVPVIGGTTTIFLISEPFLNALPVGGVQINPLGAAMKSGAPISELTFPITGGSLDTVTGDLILEHVGSGVQFTDATSNEVNVNDPVIDTGAGVVTAILTGDFGGPIGPVAATVFEIGPASILTTTPEIDSTDFLGGLDPVVPDGFAFGVLGEPDVALIPLPPTWVLFAGAIVLLGALGRRGPGRPRD